MSRWFLQLSVEDQDMLLEVVNDAVEGVVFGFFCVLDGARAIEARPDQRELELYYVKGEERVLLNPQGEELHDLFQGMRSFE
jgi:hypothetical protein